MEKILKKVEDNMGEEAVEVIKSWMEAYSLRLRRVNDTCVVYSGVFEPEEKILEIFNEKDLINLIAEHIEIYAQPDLSYEELLDLDDDYKMLTGTHLKIVSKMKGSSLKSKNVM